MWRRRRRRWPAIHTILHVLRGLRLGLGRGLPRGPGHGGDGKLLFEVTAMRGFLVEVGAFVVFLSQWCSAQHCGKMQATSKFRYRCSAHRKPKDCNAIQYMVHTLDLFTERLSGRECTAQYASPSASPGKGKGRDKAKKKVQPHNEKKVRKDIGDLCRRVYRIFAHAFFHHQRRFDEYEARHLLCSRFIMFFRKHQLVPTQLFKREIQIPAASRYFRRDARKDKLRAFAKKRRQFELQQGHELENAKRGASLTAEEFMKQVGVDA